MFSCLQGGRQKDEDGKCTPLMSLAVDVLLVSLILIMAGWHARYQQHQQTGDEEDGFDETLIPVDFKKKGKIVDDDILEMLVKPMKAGVHVTVLMDCCHSGTVLDLPYRFSADDEEMKLDNNFDFGDFLLRYGEPVAVGVCACLGFCLMAGVLTNDD